MLNLQKKTSQVYVTIFLALLKIAWTDYKNYNLHQISTDNLCSLVKTYSVPCHTFLLSASKTIKHLKINLGKYFGNPIGTTQHMTT